MTDEDADGDDGRAGGGRGGHGEVAGGNPGRTAGGTDAGEGESGLPAERGADRDITGHPAANAGMVVAVLALVGTVLPWTEAPGLVPAVLGVGSTVGAVFALIAVGAFVARRHGKAPRREGATAAGVASTGAFLTAVVRFLGPASFGGTDPVVGPGLPLSAVASVLAVALAYTDATDVETGRLVEMARRSAVGFGLMVVAFAAQYLVAIVAVGVHSLAGAPVEGLGPNGRIVLSVLLADSVFAAVALGFLVASGRGVGFVDLRRPDLRDGIYIGVGIVALFVVLIGLNILVVGLGLPRTPNSITEAARQGNPDTLLVLIPLAFLLIGPAEELLSRNVIQKYLYGPFSRSGAVVVASTVFASAHLLSYWGDTPVGMAVSLTQVFVLSLLLGSIYERTENIVVPTVVHGTFNAIQFAVLYVVIVYGDALEETAAASVALPW